MSEETETRKREVEKALVAHDALEYQQMDLILGGKKFFIDLSAPKYNHTAERFLRDRKDIKDDVIKLLASKISHRTISDEFRISHHTLHALELVMMDDIQEERRIIAKRCYDVGGMGVEKVAELMPDCKDVKNAAIATGIMLTKATELSGQPTARIEIDHKIDFHAELTYLLKEAADKVRTIKQAEGRTIEDRESSRDGGTATEEELEAAEV